MKAARYIRDFKISATASLAVEFAMIAPVLILLLFGMITFAIAFSISSGVQQLASESARASIAGLSDSERRQIAQTFVDAHVGSYPFIVPQMLTVTSSSLAGPSPSFQVSLSYDLSNQPVSALHSLLPMIPTQIRRSAVVLLSTGI
jgi:Flp pilus assembly protein TadG